MKATLYALIVIALFGFLLTPQAEAQRAGLVVGVAPANPVRPPMPNRGFVPQTNITQFTTAPAPVQPFATAPVQPFATAPVQPFFTAPVQPFATPPVHAFLPPQVPGVIVVPAQGFGGNRSFSNHRNHRTQISPTIVIPQQPQSFFAAAPPATSPQRAPLAASTSRSTVISQLGQPLVTVLTREGEVLYYNNGVTVLIQNGQVVRPK
jgi:hypothetical protein